MSLRTAAVRARNEFVKRELVTALRPINLKGAPPAPVRGGTAQQPKASQPPPSSNIPAATLIHHYGFRSTDPSATSNRITRLASITFAAGFAERTQRNNAAAAKDLTPETLKTLGGEPNRMHLEAQMIEFANASLTGGFTWLVTKYSGRKRATRIRAFNTPAHVSPLALGVFPLACIDMTPEAFLEPPPAEAIAEDDDSKAKSPTWSRSARNPSVQFTAPTKLQIELHLSRLPMSEQRKRHVESSVANLDWTFVAEQYEIAKKHFASAERYSVRNARKADLAEVAKKKLKQRGTSTDESEIGAETEAAVSVSVADDATLAASAAPTSEEPTVEQQPSQTPEAGESMPRGEGQLLGDGSIFYQLADGSQEFVRQDGSRAIVRVDGTHEEYLASNLLRFLVRPDKVQVWPSHETASELLQSLIFPDGTTTYEYRTGASITIYPDRRKVTKFSDGSIHEELPPAE
jgi:hypothetical protein